MSFSTGVHVGGGGKVRPDTRVISISSIATLIPNVDLHDIAVINAQAVPLLIENPIGSPSNRNVYVVDLKDDANVIAITYGSAFTGLFIALPNTTILGKRMVMSFMFNSTSGLWELLNVINEV